ncbi:Transmembrane protein 53-A [Sarcoptes scabiei]|uniref:Transmembrane protein 53-like protein n=2 Tax=Sarcoptes scabiei TaxID=52283 RepID=A0A834R7T8_SARSC|nr:Transmembrane protein 53-A [Sarcoptes scabiei]
MANLRSLLFDVIKTNRTSLLQDEDGGCCFNHQPSTMSSTKAMTEINTKQNQTDSIRIERNRKNQMATDWNDDDNLQNLIDPIDDGGAGESKMVDENRSPIYSKQTKLKSIEIDNLPKNNFTFHPFHLNSESSSSDNITTDDSIVFERIQKSKSLLVLFAWLFAKERHLDKYRSFYLKQGFDILTITVNVRDFIVPPLGSQVIAANVVRFIVEHSDHYESIMFHAFSVGAYQMGEVFVHLNREESKISKSVVGKLLKALVYDSAADINEAPLGLSKATTNNRFLQWAICSMMKAHFHWCYHIATKHYMASSEAVHQNEFRCPTLAFLSKDDDVVNYQDQLTTLDRWREDGVQVTIKCWDQSTHVSHFFNYPDEYRSTLIEFIRTNLGQNPSGK